MHLATTSQGDVIRFEGVTKEYPIGNLKLRVLEDVSFSVKRGEFVSIMGPSGSGKSTMLQLMGCLDLPSFGKVFIDGEDISTFSPNRLAEGRGTKNGVVFQVVHLLSNLT